MSEPSAPILEIFSGIQGEGILVGTRQVFVRFCGCNRACAYCDTREAIEPSPTCAVEREPGSRRCVAQPNPMLPFQVAEAVAALNTSPKLHHSVSLTGGEPLLYPDFIRALAPMLLDLGLPIYLETNGTLPNALEQVIDAVRHVAMDVKLTSATGQPTPWDAHRQFLHIAAARNVQVKVVVSSMATDDELERVAKVVNEGWFKAPVVLQPVTATGSMRPPSPAVMLRMHEFLARRVLNVRVIPQVHKLMGQK
ncbi:MAG TPA: 7-carboxy-7-deazaguanine synthase QueE [Planctomycetota bacterium]|nr:7-carboxy-7-deazaguanine synthase QueE [Planctomycetota bacterium]HRR81368.1 7-carboxy-7-deazaguanine synthase QueE [Planctomycetota bacterium]HRT94250.1 7-carboxy-7-deazaguanine synthase QueE [Planctomycetota bacterium]